MTPEEKDQKWLEDAKHLRRKDLLEVAKKWNHRAKRYGFSTAPPDDAAQTSEWVTFASQARRHYRDMYYGKLPQALDKFGSACEDLHSCKEILEKNGHHFGLLSDIEALVDQLSTQLADLPTP